MQHEHIVPPVIEWLIDWDRQVQPLRQRAYVAREVDALIGRGAPALYAALTVPLTPMRDMAISVLRERGYQPYLRLRKGAVPPACDPCGEALPPDKAGRVLVTKVGVLGQMPQSEIREADESKRTDAFTAHARAANARYASRLYRLVEIGPEPRPVALEDAIVVLTGWGVGVQPKRLAKKNTRDRWIVEEVSQAELTAPSPASKTKTAPEQKTD